MDDKGTVRAEAPETSVESQKPEEPGGRQDPADQAAATEQYPLAEQSSLLSLTLDEIQNAVCEPGKSFGSMNIDELLTNIWTVDKGGTDGGGSSNGPSGDPNAAADGGLPPTSLCCQGSLSIPSTLCRKTVDEVWSDIHRDQQQAPQGLMQRRQQLSLGNVVPRQSTLGEMTLEDFLIKAGVVREGGYLPCSAPVPLGQFSLQNEQQQQQNQYGLPGDYPGLDERLGYGPVVGMGYGDHPNPTATATVISHGYHQQKPLLGNCHGGGGVGCGDGGGVTGNGHVGSPMSPAVSSDGFGGGYAGSNNPGGRSRRAGGEAGKAEGSAAAEGRKRILDGPVEKVVERRQRRMMKNRESAARSRARKQAYTVELEKELNCLKEENARLQEEQRRLTARRRQMLLESMAERSQMNLRRTSKMLRQCCSCVW